LNEDHEQKPSGESRKLVTDDVSPMVSNHVEELGPSAVPHSDVSNQRQSTPKRTVVQSNPVPSSNVMDGNPHSVVHVEDTVSAFSRAESFPVSGKLSEVSSTSDFNPREVLHNLYDCKKERLMWNLCLSITDILSTPEPLYRFLKLDIGNTN
jgi:hypothetical protein